MTIDLSGIPFGFVKDVDFVLVAEEHLMYPPSKNAHKETKNKKLTIIALTRVLPPSVNEPADCADVDTMEAAEQANKNKCFIVAEVGPTDSRVVEGEDGFEDERKRKSPVKNAKRAPSCCRRDPRHGDYVSLLIKSHFGVLPRRTEDILHYLWTEVY
jgi:hypothetical protein